MNMPFDFSDKVCVITGATGGIGRATAEVLHIGGARLVLSDLDAGMLDRLADDLGGPDAGVTTVVADSADKASPERLVERTVDLHGRIDVVVPCAGIHRRVALAETSDEVWRDVMEVNLDGVFRLIRASIPHLTPTASIVTVASLAAHRGAFLEGHYAVSKAGIVSLTMSLALELGPRGIRANAVSPGVIETTMTTDFIATQGDRLRAEIPMDRFGKPHEVANVIAFLASDLSSYVTGAHIHVNGGVWLSA